jgi:hypothetical protein
MPGLQDKRGEDTWQHFWHSRIFPFGWDRPAIVEGAALSAGNLTRSRVQRGMVPANDFLGLQACIFLSHEEGHMQAEDVRKECSTISVKAPKGGEITSLKLARVTNG